MVSLRHFSNGNCLPVASTHVTFRVSSVSLHLSHRSQSVVLKWSPSQGPRLQWRSLVSPSSVALQLSAGSSLPSSPSLAERQVTERYWRASPHFSEQALHGPRCHSGQEKRLQVCLTGMGWGELGNVGNF